MNYLKRLAKLEGLIALVCISIPFILKIADCNCPFRTSISDYVYMDRSYIFGMLLTIAAMMFIFNGVIYFKNTNILIREKKPARWYNIILGLALLGVVVFPHKEYVVLHYFFAILFFAGSAIAIAFFNNKRHRKISFFIAFLSILSLLLYVIDNSIMSLFWAEWISLTVIAIHYYLETEGIITLNQQRMNL